MKISIESKYLKSADIPEGEFQPHTIDRVEHQNLAQEGKPAEMKYITYFRGLEKGMVMNTGNLNILMEAYGDESDDWSGKPVLIYITPTNTPDGKACMGLRLSIPKKVAAKPVGVNAADDARKATFMALKTTLSPDATKEEISAAWIKAVTAKFPGRQQVTVTAAEWKALENEIVPPLAPYVGEGIDNSEIPF